MSHSFYALLSRMRYISRWGLMRSTERENLAEHSLQCALFAHALALVGNRYFQKSYDAQQAALLALFHDASEILTGDMPTPIKYANPALREAYRTVEAEAVEGLLNRLPEELREDYRPLLKEEAPAELTALVKAADKLCAYCKCMEELKSGNREFAAAARANAAAVADLHLPEADWFMTHCAPAFSLELDAQ